MKRLFLLLTCTAVLFGCGNKDNGTKETENLFNEPLLMFGASQATVKNSETKTLVEEAPIDEITTGLFYKASGYGIIYYFRNDKLINSTIVLPVYTDKEKLSAFLSSKYEYAGISNGIKIWMFKSKGLIVGLVEDTDVIGVMYEPYTKGESDNEGPFTLKLTPATGKNTFKEIFK